MATADFTAKRPIRGKLTNFRTAEFYEFQLNPTSIKDGKGQNYAIDDLPGSSDPLVRWASGKLNHIKFTLELDAEVTRRWRGDAFPNPQAVNAITGIGKYTIQGELDFLEHLTLPSDPTQNGANGAPDLAVFYFGPRYPGVLVACDIPDIDITQFDPDLRPTRAKVQVELKRIVTEQRLNYHTWYNGGKL